MNPCERTRQTIDVLMEPVLELRNATLIRGRTRVFEGLSLSIAHGEHTAVLGPNGAGKTSLIRMLTLDDRPRSTENGVPPGLPGLDGVPPGLPERLDGVPPLRLFGRSSWDLTELRTRLGVVTGDLDAGFGMGTSGGRVCGLDVALSGLLSSHGVFAHHDVTDEMRGRARQALDRVEASHLAARPLNEMSAGERRRVLIARALITAPQALVLDEPTAGLDPVARYRFMESIRRLAQEGTTLIIVTHHIDEIIPEIGRVVLLREGRVVFDGPTGQALTSERLGNVFGGAVVVEHNRGYFHVRPG
jgi:iron complex transport system ATP-binding protein